MESLNETEPLEQIDSNIKSTEDETLKLKNKENMDTKERDSRSTLESIEKTERMRDNATTKKAKLVYDSPLQRIRWKLKDTV